MARPLAHARLRLVFVLVPLRLQLFVFGLFALAFLLVPPLVRARLPPLPNLLQQLQEPVRTLVQRPRLEVVGAVSTRVLAQLRRCRVQLPARPLELRVVHQWLPRVLVELLVRPVAVRLSGVFPRPRPRVIAVERRPLAQLRRGLVQADAPHVPLLLADLLVVWAGGRRQVAQPVAALHALPEEV